MYKILMLLKLTSVHAPTVKMVHNYITTLCMRSKIHSKTSTKTVGANFRLGARYLVAASLIKSYQVVYKYNLASTVHST